MPSFNWRAADPGVGRMPEWARGTDIWRTLAARPSIEVWQTSYALLRRQLDERPFPAAHLACPRVFISHRRDDFRLARRAAWLATRAGFQYWLDVEDPVLTALPFAGLTAEHEALLTACIIELALLNSSHVLAVITKDTRGSMWVPYEYGRVKTLPAGWQAGCWLSPDVRGKPITPEYLQLSVVTTKELEITSWLQNELQTWTQITGACSGGSSDNWPGAEPEERLD
jgi:hypothetical protein